MDDPGSSWLVLICFIVIAIALLWLHDRPDHQPVSVAHVPPWTVNR